MSIEPAASADRTTLAALDTLEAERRRLADQLNSSVIAPLHLLLSQANVYEQTLSGDPQTGMVISVLSMLARQVLQQTLDLQANLHPALLEALGLDAALETLTHQLSRAHGVRVTLKLERLPVRLPVALELTIFRAMQDAFEVAIKQARASQLDLHSSLPAGWFQLTLRDNGVSLPVRTLPAITITRIRQQHGEIETLPDAVRLRFPLTAPVELTPREQEVLALVAEGLTNKEIGQRLNLSARTINFHLDNIFSKIGVNTRTEAAVYALQHRLQPPG